MDNTSSTIQAFGERVSDVWRGMRPATRSLVERALANVAAPPASSKVSRNKRTALYDAPAEAELSRLLIALDERASEGGARRANNLDAQQQAELTRMIRTCAGVLQTTAQSAEPFAQLLTRALNVRDYAAIDSLADSLLVQLPPSEICELARDTHPAVRAVAEEALAQLPISSLVELLADPVDSDYARAALIRLARDYDSEEARWVLDAFADADDMDFD